MIVPAVILDAVMTDIINCNVACCKVIVISKSYPTVKGLFIMLNTCMMSAC